MINNRLKKFSVLLLVFCSFVFNAALAQTVSIKTQTNVSCNGGTNGSFEVQVSGGSPVFRYSIFGGSPYQYSPVFNNLPAASYVVTVTDTLGGSDTVQVHVLEPSALILSVASKTNVTCNGLSDGTVNLSSNGGTAGYSYKAGSGTYQSSNAFINVNPGTTIFSVLDVNGCIDTQYVVITEPTALNLSLVKSDVTCNGLGNASITSSGSGGLIPYLYSLNGGTYQTSNSFSALSAGTYTVTIKDINGCTYNKSVIIPNPHL